MFTLALIQMRVDGGAKEENLARAEEYIAQAASGGAQIVLLPEALNVGWTHSSARTEADEIPDGKACMRMRAAAQQHGVHVCLGLIERAGKLRFNSAVLIDPSGAVLLHHRKLNELAIAHDLYACGDRLGVAHTALGTIGLMICADGFAAGQVVSRTLALMGASVILSPCAWAVTAEHNDYREPYGRVWLENYGPVAREFRTWIAGCSNVGPIIDGPWRGRNCIGCSLVIGPQGETVLRGPYGVNAETILYVDVNPDPAPRRAG